MTANGDVNTQFFSEPSIVESHSSYALFREEKELFQRHLRPGFSPIRALKRGMKG